MNRILHSLSTALAAWSEGVTARSLLDPAFKCAALLLAGFAISAALRRLSAAHRSLAWLAVFTTLLVLPLAVLVTPRWTVPVVTTKAVKPPLIAIPPGSEPREADVFAQPEQSRVEITASARWSCGELLAASYLAGVALVLGYRAVGALMLRGVQRRTFAADTRATDFAARLRERLGIRRCIRVHVSKAVAVPMTWGVYKPVLLLPAEAAQWTDVDLRAALEHEMAHIRHHDAACRWLATLACALWWPQPLVWLAARAWRIEQERACDDAAVRSGADPARYATQLIRAARAARHGAFRTAAALVMAMPSGLETRLRSVMSARVSRSPAGLAAKTMCGAAAVLAATVCALCQAEQAGAPPQEGKVIHIVTKFIEVANAEEAAKEFPALREAKDGTPVIMSDAKLQDLLHGLSQRKGVDIMSAPSVTTKAGQKAAVEVVREFLFPTEFSEEDGHLVPVTFEMMPIGVITEVTPALRPDGSIALNATTAKVNEFGGFVVVTKEQLQPAADKVRLKFNDARPVEGRRVLVAEGIAPKAPLSETMQKLKLDVKKGEVSKPVFHTRQWTGEPQLKPGEWQLAALVPANPAKPGESRVIWFAISASVTKAKPARALPKDEPLQLEAEFIETAESPATSFVIGTDSVKEADYTGVLTNAQADKLKKHLASKDGTRVLAAPRLVTLSGRKGVIEIGNEISYPAAFSADGKPVARTERKRTGISLEVTPVLTDAGVIDLTLKPSVTELLGWQLAGRDDLVSQEPKDQGAYSPRFSTRILTSSLSVLPGELVVLSLGKSKEGKSTFCLVRCEPADAGAVTVFGQVRRQGKYEHKEGMTLKDLLDLAQGAADEAVEIEIISGKDESKKTHRMTRPWDTTRALRPGDTVTVR